MNSKITLWLKPTIRNHTECTETLYFSIITKANYDGYDLREIESELDITSIMNFADIELVNNFGVITVEKTNDKEGIVLIDNPNVNSSSKLVKTKKEKSIKLKTNKLTDLISGKKKFELSKKHITIKDNRELDIVVKNLGIKEILDFPKIWSIIENKIIGKIPEGSTVVLSDNEGNKIIEVIGGSFLNIGLADLFIYDTKKKSKKINLFNMNNGLKGGLFIRENGRLDIGDLKRTFWLKIYTDNLIKYSIKNKLSLDNNITKLLT